MIQLRTNWKEFGGHLRKLLGRVRNFEPIAEAFGARLVRTWSLKFPRGAGHRPSAAGGPPAIQNAALKNSLDYEVHDGGDTLEAGSPLAYAAIQHFGGVIKPKTAKALTIPLTRESYGKRARDFNDLEFRPATKKAKPNIIGVLGRASPGGGFAALFALAREVTLPARPWLMVYPADEEYLADCIEKHLEGQGV